MSYWQPRKVRRGIQPRRKGWFGRPRSTSMTVALLDKPWPIIQVGAKAHGKMMALVRACPIEVGWLSSCTRKGETFVIDDVFVPDQLCTMVSTKITADGEAKLLTHLMQSGKAETIARLHCWGHSHVNMAVFASSVDEQQTDEFIGKRDEYFVRLIANKKGDLFGSVYYLDTGVVIHNPTLRLSAPATQQWTKWAKTQLDKRVTREVLTANNCVFDELDMADTDQDTISLWLASGFIDDNAAERLRALHSH